MTKDEIMTLANQTSGQHWMDEAHIQRFAALVAAAEREACAKVCDYQITRWTDDRAALCGWRVRCSHPHPRQPMIKLNTDKSAAVNQSLTWLSIDDHHPPVGAKLLLINRANGVAVLGTYQAKHQWTHWQGLPKFSDEQK